ncbi:MAG: PQQ-binding-like beta-propeller repeat protein [Bacteroidaceae bacterium]|nr:PQQ-binding-like beta-propeller repeat protein [Bacteroidaceae bacterium]
MKKILFLSLSLLAATLVTAQVKPFRFAQLTDIHLNPNGEGPTKALMASIDQINQTDSIDFVLVTGDLTEQGDTRMMRQVKACLDHLNRPYHVCMGNHETTWSESGCTGYSRIFGPEYYSFEYGGVLFLLFNTGPLLKMAYGHVSPFVTTWATKELQAHRNMPAIVVTHYPLMEGDVDNWYDVTDALRRPGNVRLFIGGHYHALRLLRYDGMPGILMRSNLPDEDKKPGYGIYEVNGNEIRAYVQRVGEEKQFVQSYTMQQPDYDPNGKAEKYPDYSDNEHFPQVREQWTAQAGAAIYSSPSVEKKRVFVGDDEGRVQAFSLRDGKKLWEFSAKARVVGGPTASCGIVVFGSADSKIYALDAVNGKLRWTLKASQPVLGAVSIDGGTAYVGASDSTFRAIDIRTGRLVWAYKGLRGYVMTKPLVTHDKVIFGAWDNTLYCLRRADGQELWRWTGGLSRMHFSPAQVWPVTSNGCVFIVDPQRAMTAIDLETGETRWRTFQSKVRESLGLSADGQRLYAKTMQDSIVCFAAQGDAPRQLWATDAGIGYEHAPCMLPERDGIVFGSTNDGVSFALEGKTGRLLWRHKTGNSLMNTLVPLGKRRLLFSNTEGNVGLLTY